MTYLSYSTAIVCVCVCVCVCACVRACVRACARVRVIFVWFVRRDAILINIVSFLTSLYAGFAVFSIIGYMAVTQGVDIKDVIQSGTSPGSSLVCLLVRVWYWCHGLSLETVVIRSVNKLKAAWHNIVNQSENGYD